MKILHLTLISLLTLTLSACIWDISEDKKDSDNSPQELILAKSTLYIPEDGDQITTQMTFHLTDVDGNSLGDSTYNKTILFNHVNTLPELYAYQHADSGPYLRSESFKIQPNAPIKTRDISFYTLTNDPDLLISHDVNDQYYSTAEFNQSTNTSTDQQDDLMIAGEVITKVERNILFDDSTSIEIGIDTNSLTLTALSNEEITIPAGTFNSAKANFQGDSRIEIYTHLSGSSLQSATGTYWFDVDTGSTLKYSISGTIIFDDKPNQVFNFSQTSELIYSAEFDNQNPEDETGGKVTKLNTDINHTQTVTKALFQRNLEITEDISEKISVMRLN